MGFTSSLGGYRTIIPQVGETLAELALRELGDAAKWPLIAWANDLKHPYVVDVASLVEPGVVLAGTPLLVPSSTAEPSRKAEDLYFTDLALADGRLSVEGGDLAVVSGVANLSQGLRQRILVDKRELLFHPSYGCFLRRLLGRPNTAQQARLAEFYVRSSLREDERVREVQSCVASIRGDAVLVEATVIAVSGVTLDVEVSL